MLLNHCVHYLLANTAYELITKELEKSTRTPEPTSIYGSRRTCDRRSSLLNQFSFSNITNATLSSIDFSQDKLRSTENFDCFTNEEYKDSVMLKNFLYDTQSFLNEMNTESQQKRVDQFNKYAKWKMTKWSRAFQR